MTINATTFVVVCFVLTILLYTSSIIDPSSVSAFSIVSLSSRTRSRTGSVKLLLTTKKTTTSTQATALFAKEEKGKKKKKWFDLMVWEAGTPPPAINRRTSTSGRKRQAVTKALSKVLKSVRHKNIVYDTGGSYDSTESLTLEEKGLLAFDEMDVDGDGVLSKSELSRAGVQMNVFNSLDDDQNGNIERDEFVQGIQLLEDDNGDDKDTKEEDNINHAIFENEKDNFFPHNNKNNNDTTDAAVDEIVDKFEEQIGALEPLERQELRLGGFEPYILVAVLTAQSSFEEISSTNVNSWTHIVHPTSILDVLSSDLLNAIILLSAGLSTIAGIYATVVFSLTILYGKTALGMDRDEVYYAFMDGTGAQRFRAFQAFTYGLFFFLISVCTELCLKCPTEFRLLSVTLAVVVFYYGKKDYDHIMAAASPMFAPKVVAPSSSSFTLQEDEEEKEEMDVVVEPTNNGTYIAPPSTITAHSNNRND